MCTTTSLRRTIRVSLPGSTSRSNAIPSALPTWRNGRTPSSWRCSSGCMTTEPSCARKESRFPAPGPTSAERGGHGCSLGRRGDRPAGVGTPGAIHCLGGLRGLRPDLPSSRSAALWCARESPRFTVRSGTPRARSWAHVRATCRPDHPAARAPTPEALRQSLGYEPHDVRLRRPGDSCITVYLGASHGKVLAPIQGAHALPHAVGHFIHNARGCAAQRLA